MGKYRKPEQSSHDQRQREKTIVRTSIIGIIANVSLALFKAGVGLFTNSVAILMDAVNNFSDASSSLITIIGTKLAAKKPDKKHPFGHGRIEYLSTLIISAIVLDAGVSSMMESVKKIIHPATPKYTTVSLVIVAVAVVVKIVLGYYVKTVGKRVNSDSLINSGEDATLDSVISASTLVAAVIFMISGISLEAWLGAIISGVIIKSGVEMLRDTVSRILGEQNDIELAKAIKNTVSEFPLVHGVYDLVLNNYGPETWNGSLHIEVPDTCMAADLDQLLREIQIAVYEKHRVVLTAIGVYSVNTHDEEVIRARERIQKIVLGHQYARQIHGFYLIKEEKTIRFDVVISFDADNRELVYKNILEDVQNAFPDYQFQVALDTDFGEE